MPCNWDMPRNTGVPSGMSVLVPRHLIDLSKRTHPDVPQPTGCCGCNFEEVDFVCEAFVCSLPFHGCLNVADQRHVQKAGGQACTTFPTPHDLDYHNKLGSKPRYMLDKRHRRLLELYSILLFPTGAWERSTVVMTSRYQVWCKLASEQNPITSMLQYPGRDHSMDHVKHQ